jgi:hypothetical protein
MPTEQTLSRAVFLPAVALRPLSQRKREAYPQHRPQPQQSLINKKTPTGIQIALDENLAGG